MAKKIVENVNGVKVGDVFYTSFGYNMSLVNFYLVVDTTRTCARLKRLAVEVVDGDLSEGHIVPTLDKFVDDEDIVLKNTRKDDMGKDPYIVNLDYKHCGFLWDGKPKYVNHWD